jgi:polyphosphate kinase 2 (PPK2 family)
MVPADEIEKRYGIIADFEAELAASGTTIIKIMLHISPAEQKARLLARLDDPTKQWKFNPEDVDERAFWMQYQEAYEIAIRRTTTDVAPWYVVPGDHKWYSRLAVQDILLTHLRALNVDWPGPTYDVAAQRARVEASTL